MGRQEAAHIPVTLSRVRAALLLPSFTLSIVEQTQNLLDLVRQTPGSCPGATVQYEIRRTATVGAIQETSGDAPSSGVTFDDWLLSQQVTHTFPGITALASLPAGEH